MQIWLQSVMMFAALTLAGPANAGAWEDARAADHRGNYDVELSILRSLAQQGDAAAEFQIGNMYVEGHGLPKSILDAYWMWEEAAKHGHAEAQYEIGRKEDFISKPKEAIKWYRLSAEQGSSSAQYQLALKYADGRSVPQDYEQSIKWYQLSAEQGNALAQGGLGNMYLVGRGVPIDYVLAHMWTNLAAAGGNEMAPLNRDSIAAKMTSAQITKAQQLAREWKPKSPK